MGTCKNCTIDASLLSTTDNCLGGDFNTFAGFHCPRADQYNDLAVLVFHPKRLPDG
eukprot:gene20091-26808_t